MIHALDSNVLRASWRHWLWHDERPDTGPAWLRWLWPFVYAAVVALPFAILSLALSAAGDAPWHGPFDLLRIYAGNFVVSLAITFAIMGTFRIVVLTLGRPRIERLSEPRRGLLFGGASLVGVSIGWPVGFVLLGGRFELLARMSAQSLIASVALCGLFCWLFYLYFSLKRKEMRAQLQAQEARLRLLQGQMEPHFLFNTLANVICMIDTDARGAQRQLEMLTDYLRVSLGGLRDGDSTVGNELALANHYLRLMQARMGERLQVQITSDPDLQAIALPPLLLQPLVENAIKHGLEPAVAGGTVRVDIARAPGNGPARLQVSVEDDGVGLHDADAVAGNGVALANLRERLRTRFGRDAFFALDARPGGGTRARIVLPLLSNVDVRQRPTSDEPPPRPAVAQVRQRPSA
ncbi:MAG TPA: histidine kinase [Burkholderiaceae bacterium]|jgi:signal transduction histidine kinase|nr:histidine kinase [Burkholderiaceae bacterium]